VQRETVLSRASCMCDCTQRCMALKRPQRYIHPVSLVSSSDAPSASLRMCSVSSKRRSDRGCRNPSVSECHKPPRSLSSKRPSDGGCCHPSASECHQPPRSLWAGTDVTAVDPFPTSTSSAVGPPTPSSALHVPCPEWLSKPCCVASDELRAPPGNVVRACASEIKSGRACHRSEHRTAQYMP